MPSPVDVSRGSAGEDKRTPRRCKTSRFRGANTCEASIRACGVEVHVLRNGVFPMLVPLRPIKVPPMESWLSLIHISEPTRLGMISYAVFCLKKKKKKKKQTKIKH